MSENLSLDEIIKRAEAIKSKAEQQLAEAEKSLNEQTKAVVEQVEVDAEKVLQSVAEIAQAEDDIKEFSLSPKKQEKTRTIPLPSLKKEKTRVIQPLHTEPDDEDEDIKIAPQFSKIKAVRIDDDEDMKIVPDKSSEDNIEATKPVILSTKSRKSEDDLDEIPTIVAHDNIDRVFDNGAQDDDEDYGLQMTFDGFDDAVESVETIDEELAEQILQERRQEKIGKFRLFGPDETDTSLNDKTVVKDDYVSKDKTVEFLSSLLARKSSINVKLLATFLIGVPMLFLTMFKDKAIMPNFLNGHIVYFVVALVLMIATVVININVIVHGFNLKKGINFDFPVAVLNVVTIIHTVAMLFSESLWIDDGVLLCSVASFGLFMSQLGKRQMMVRIIDNFEYISANDDKYTVENIANEVDAKIITRGVVDDIEPIVKTSVKTDLPTNFMEISCKNEPADRLSKIIVPVIFCLSMLLMLIVGLIDNFNTGLNCALCALAVSTPITSLFLTNDMLFDISVALDKYGSRVCGYEGALMAGSADVMVMEAADLFGDKCCDLHGIKTFNRARVDDAIIMAAAVVIQTNSPLARAFDSVIIGKQSILPKVENVIYEEKMGTSAWIYNSKVLVGTRDLLIRHNVDVPAESFEQKYTRKGRKAMYLAVGGDIVAMFVFSYSADPDLKRELRKLEKSGVSLIVKSCDPYINEESLAKLFDLPNGYIHVMNSSAARVYDKYSNMSVEKSPAYIVHNGTALGFVSAMRGASVAIVAKKLIEFLVAFGVGLGFIAIALLSIVKGYSQITCVNIIAFQVIWSMFMLIVGKLRRVGI